jgi:hemerythrin
MKLLEWRPSYSVGVKELDEQHKNLLVLINELANENPDHSPKRCFVALNDLVKYAQKHFESGGN